MKVVKQNKHQYSFFKSFFNLPFSTYINKIKNPKLRKLFKVLHLVFIAFILVCLIGFFLMEKTIKDKPSIYYHNEAKATFPSGSHHKGLIYLYRNQGKKKFFYSFIKGSNFYIQENYEVASNTMKKATREKVTDDLKAYHQVPIYVQLQVISDNNLPKELHQLNSTFNYSLKQIQNNISFEKQKSQIFTKIRIKRQSHQFKVHLEGLSVDYLTDLSTKKKIKIKNNIFFNDLTSQDYFKSKKLNPNNYTIINIKCSNKKTVYFYTLNKQHKLKIFKNSGSHDL